MSKIRRTPTSVLSMVGAAALAVAAGAASQPADAASRRTTTTAKRRAATTRRSTTTAVSTQTFQLPAGDLKEVSGCAVSRRTPDRVWLHNDSGDSARVFWLDLKTRARGAVEVRGAQAVDWEDMAAGPGETLVVADIGDNDRRRANVVLYRFPEPAPGVAAVDATAETLTYEDGPHDAEALAVDPADCTAYVVTKEASGIAAVYRAGEGSLRRIGAVTISGEVLFFPNQVTAADAMPDGSGVVLRTYQSGYVLRPSKKPATLAGAFAATPVPLGMPLMGQAEALCLTPDGRFAVTASEATGGTAFPVAVVPLPR